LDLSKNLITDYELNKLIDGLKKFSLLEVLNLTNNSLTLDGIGFLIKEVFPSTKRLHTIHLDGNFFSMRSIQMLGAYASETPSIHRIWVRENKRIDKIDCSNFEGVHKLVVSDMYEAIYAFMETRFARRKDGDHAICWRVVQWLLLF
jgi:hypothetical protein